MARVDDVTHETAIGTSVLYRVVRLIAGEESLVLAIGRRAVLLLRTALRLLAILRDERRAARSLGVLTRAGRAPLLRGRRRMLGWGRVGGVRGSRVGIHLPNSRLPAPGHAR